MGAMTTLHELIATVNGGPPLPCELTAVPGGWVVRVDWPADTSVPHGHVDVVITGEQFTLSGRAAYDKISSVLGHPAVAMVGIGPLHRIDPRGNR